MERLTRRDETGDAIISALSDMTADLYTGLGDNEQFLTDALNKLAAYEDAEEQGRLVVLPCKVGDKVYRPWPCGKNGKSVSELIVNHVDIDFLPEIEFACRKEKTTGNYWFFKATDIGKSYFLTREEAEKALEGMG